MKRFVLFTLLGLSGCTHNTGLGYRNLNVEATHADGSAVEGFPEKSCTTLPLLLGSRSSAHFELGEGADVDVDATRDDARIVIAAAGYDKTVSADQLESGFSDQIDVTSATGEAFVVTLSSSCPAVTTP
jgi:hypothetical protein